MNLKRVCATAATTALLTTGLALGGATAASADPVKTCVTGPGNSGFTQEQRSSCNSSTENNKGPVTNRGGNTPGGFN